MCGERLRPRITRVDLLPMPIFRFGSGTVGRLTSTRRLDVSRRESGVRIVNFTKRTHFGRSRWVKPGQGESRQGEAFMICHLGQKNWGATERKSLEPRQIKVNQAWARRIGGRARVFTEEIKANQSKSNQIQPNPTYRFLRVLRSVWFCDTSKRSARKGREQANRYRDEPCVDCRRLEPIRAHASFSHRKTT